MSITLIVWNSLIGMKRNSTEVIFYIILDKPQYDICAYILDLECSQDGREYHIDDQQQFLNYHLGLGSRFPLYLAE